MSDVKRFEKIKNEGFEKWSERLLKNYGEEIIQQALYEWDVSSLDEAWECNLLLEVEDECEVYKSLE